MNQQVNHHFVPGTKIQALTYYEPHIENSPLEASDLPRQGFLQLCFLKFSSRSQKLGF